MTDIEKIKQGKGIFNFKGTLVNQLVGGWSIFKIVCTTPEQVIKVYDDAHKSIESSIERGKSITVSCLNGYNGCFNDKVVG